MTDRIRLDELTSDQLDALYDRIATLEHVATGNRRHVQYAVPELERAEAAIARVRDLHYQQDGAYCAICTEDFGRLQADWPCPTIAALDEPTPVAGPAAAEPAVSRVIALYERWVKAGPPPLGTSTARWWDARLVELHDAVQPPAPAAPFVDRPFRTHRQQP